MFNEYYGFTYLPFSKTIPTSDLFATAGQKELAARLTYLVRERGFGLITGEIGSGKSTAVRAFNASLDPNRYLVLYLANPTTGITGVFRDLLLGLGHEPPFSRPRLVARLREAFAALCGVDIGVVINDSLGRAWRLGTVGVAIGVAGLPGLLDRRGERDLQGRLLLTTEVGMADELAAAASAVMGQASEGRPAVLIRGVPWPRREGSARELQRLREKDFFR